MAGLHRLHCQVSISTGRFAHSVFAKNVFIYLSRGLAPVTFTKHAKYPLCGITMGAASYIVAMLCRRNPITRSHITMEDKFVRPRGVDPAGGATFRDMELEFSWCD